MSPRRDLWSRSEALFGMDEATWRRHANPWSVWTRVPIVPALTLSFWAWTWINPCAFPPPARLSAWSSRGVAGERLFPSRTALAEQGRPLPRRHVRAALLLTAVSVTGVLPLAYGLIALNGWAVLSGLLLSFGAKMGFIDRMVRLHDEVREVGQAS